MLFLRNIVSMHKFIVNAFRLECFERELKRTFAKFNFALTKKCSERFIQGCSIPNSPRILKVR